MPEATIDKHGHLGSRKYKVRAATELWDRPRIDAVAQAPSMQL